MAIFVSPFTGFSSSRFNVALGPYKPTSDHALGGYTILCKFRRSLLRVTGSKVRLTLQGFINPLTHLSATLNNVTISTASTATGAKAWDSTTTPTAITFGGSASVTLARDAVRASDEITFEVDGTKPLIIGFNLAASAYASFSGGLTDEHVLFRKAAVQEADDATRGASYTVTSGVSAYIKTLEVFS